MQVPALEQVSVVQVNPSPQEATPQQTASTQLPEAQANPWLQGAPLGSFWQVVPTQLLPPEGSEVDGVKSLQSAKVPVHVVLHWPIPESHW